MAKFFFLFFLWKMEQQSVESAMCMSMCCSSPARTSSISHSDQTSCLHHVVSSSQPTCVSFLLSILFLHYAHDPTRGCIFLCCLPTTCWARSSQHRPLTVSFSPALACNSWAHFFLSYYLHFACARSSCSSAYSSLSHASWKFLPAPCP